MVVELIDDFFAEYPATAGSDKVDTAEADEVIDAIAKTVAVTNEPAGRHHPPGSDRAVDAPNYVLRRRVSP
jgi:hypothetical protein